MLLDVLEPDRQAEPHPEISVVIPVFNEADNIRPLYERIHAAMEAGPRTWEAVFVDDGSTDASFEILQAVRRQDARIRVVRLRRNFGQTAALAAGFDAARGAIIVSMDGDLQNDPWDIDALVRKLDEGYDVVSGWRVHRRESFWRRRLPSRIANWLISQITGTHLHDYGCTLKAYRAEVVKELRLYGEMHRFIPALLAGNGARIAELPVEHHPRQHGQSKYGMARTVRVLLDLVTVKFWLSSLTNPLQMFGRLGLGTFGTGLAICGYLASLKLLWGQALADRPLLFLGVLLAIIGVQFLCMGILAEIQIRTYHESSKKSIYVIREILDSNNPEVTSADLKQSETPVISHRQRA